jgi:phage terminase small subunit
MVRIVATALSSDAPPAPDTPPVPAPGSQPLLRARYERACAEYLVDLNWLAACVRAGFAKSSHTKDVWKRPEIQARVAFLIVEREKESRVKAFRVLEELATVALSSLDHYEISVDGKVKLAKGAPENALGAVASIKRKTRVSKRGVVEHAVEIKLWDKNPAIANALRHLGLMTERTSVEHSGPGGGPIPVAVDDLRDNLTRRIAGIASRIGTPSVHPVAHGSGAGRN